MPKLRVLTTIAVASGSLVLLAPFGCSSNTPSSGFAAPTTRDASFDIDATTPTFEVDASAPIDDSGGVLQDALPTVDAEGCTPEDAGPGPVPRDCKPQTTNECDGLHDAPGAINGTGGNGFDDDCDGQVDEGCACPSAGVTKECFLVPPSQINSVTRKPVGWCESNSKGTMECQGGERRVWSGECRGAQPPFPDDVCAPGDFNCDGKEFNSMTQDCSCKGDPVQCPTAPIVTVPYPRPTSLPVKIDAATWMQNPAMIGQTSDWTWTLRGGDCDNILPHPTFSIYATDDGSGAPVGHTVGTLGASGKERGTVASSPVVTSSVYPAFSLSGDYFLEGAFKLNGKSYSCLQKIQVRAPGLRAEACWDTESDGVDLDLHMARTDLSTCSGPKGWESTCPGQDCYYANCKSGSLSKPNWGYTPAPSTDACVGWGSSATGSCGNPRLDRDANGGFGCDANESNPNAVDSDAFCGPENINVDAPDVGSKYAVGLKYFAGSLPSRAHVNVYCNGERVLSSGYNPVTGNLFPSLQTSSGTSGDLWKVALVTITAPDSGAGIACQVEPVPSQAPYLPTDGSSAYCIDNAERNTQDSMKYFAQGGYAPADPRVLCFH